MTDLLGDDIRYYLPHAPDPTLDTGEYYYLQYTSGREQVIRVYALDILPCKDGSTEYGIYQRRGSRLMRIYGGWDDPGRGVSMSELYDNKQDCKDQTHMGCSWWESLREKQREMSQ